LWNGEWHRVFYVVGLGIGWRVGDRELYWR